MTNTFYGGEEKQKRRKISFFSKREKMEKEKEEHVWRRKIFFLWIRRKTEKERGNYFEKEIVFFLEEGKVGK